MSLFKRKLTPWQQEEVLKFAHDFYSICSPCQEAFTEFASHIGDLYHICKESLQRNAKLEGVDYMVIKAREASVKYAEFLVSTYDKYLNLKKPAKWYPKELRKVYDTWGVCLHGEIEYLRCAVIYGLQLPKPLEHQPEVGNDKLNLFVSGVNYVSFFETRLRQSPLYDVRSTELLLGIDLSFEDVKRITQQT
jgi:hypothetical protein